MRQKICFVVAVPVTANAFLRDHIDALSRDFDIYLVGNIKDENEVKGLKIAGWHHIDIERGISFGKDIKAVWQTICYFKKMKFDVVHSVTPKAGPASYLYCWPCMSATPRSVSTTTMYQTLFISISINGIVGHADIHTAPHIGQQLILVVKATKQVDKRARPSGYSRRHTARSAIGLSHIHRLDKGLRAIECGHIGRLGDCRVTDGPSDALCAR